MTTTRLVETVRELNQRKQEFEETRAKETNKGVGGNYSYWNIRIEEKKLEQFITDLKEQRVWFQSFPKKTKVHFHQSMNLPKTIEELKELIDIVIRTMMEANKEQFDNRLAEIEEALQEART